MNTTKALLLLECNIDDLNPEFFPIVIDRLLTLGARDAWVTPIIMKHGRPAQMLSALVDPSLRQAASELIYLQTSTLGIRIQQVERDELAREMLEVVTEFGLVPVKIARDPSGRITNAAPEVRICATLAEQHSVPVKLVYHEALRKVDYR